MPEVLGDSWTVRSFGGFTICLSNAVKSAAPMKTSTSGELNAKNALLQRGNLKTKHGILTAIIVNNGLAASLMEEAEQ